MKTRTLRALLGCAIVAHFAVGTAHAGHVIAPAPDKSKIADPADDWFPPGMVTLGGKFSEDLTSGYLDSVTPFAYTHGFMAFLNTRSTLDDNSQYLSSYGLGFRYLVPDHEIIIGANVFYDSIESQFGNHFDQLGIGVELLTHWFDARANWYLPDDGEFVSSSFTRTRTHSETGSPFVDNDLIKQRTTRTTERTTFRRFESGLEGYNLEGGFLVPGLDRYFELRVLAGYYHYDGAFGKSLEGFKARAEARFLPGLIGDVEYWDDSELVGGHWVAGVRMSVPFSIANLFTGKNPFEGASDMFRPRKREFRERLSEMVIRSHRVQTTESAPQPGKTTTSKDSSDKTIGNVPPPPPPPPEQDQQQEG